MVDSLDLLPLQTEFDVSSAFFLICDLVDGE